MNVVVVDNDDVIVVVVFDAAAVVEELWTKTAQINHNEAEQDKINLVNGATVD